MRKLFVLVLVIAMPGVILADAADGQFMGFQLGNNYQRGANTQAIVTTNGNLKITAENPVKPANVGDVTLIATPETLTIGYINALPGSTPKPKRASSAARTSGYCAPSTRTGRLVAK